MAEWQTEWGNGKRNGEMAEWRNGRMVEWRNGGMAEWRDGGMAEWQNGGMVEWRMEYGMRDRMAEWSNGRMATYLLHLWYMPPTTTTPTPLNLL